MFHKFVSRLYWKWNSSKFQSTKYFTSASKVVYLKQCSNNTVRTLSTLNGLQSRCRPIQSSSLLRKHQIFPQLAQPDFIRLSFGQVYGFHTSQQRCVPPIIWIFIKPIAKLVALLSGRTARKWWQRLPAEERQNVWSKIKQRWYLFAGLVAALAGSSVAYYQAHIEETPLTGRKRFIALTHDQYMDICLAEAEEYMEELRDKILPTSHPYCQRVQKILDRIIQANYQQIHDLMGNLEWKCCIVDDPKMVNAVVLPTGHIFVYTGIIVMADNDDQLATVLAHEMTHALLSHSLELIGYSQLLDYFIIVAMAAIWFFMPTDGISLITQWFNDKIIKLMLHLPYSRLLEKEADKIGIELTARACYDVREGSVFWAMMDLDENANELAGADSTQIPEWLSTHPSNWNRAKYFDHLLSQAEQLRLEAKCPVLSKKDPRERIKELSDVINNLQRARLAKQNLSLVDRNTMQIGVDAIAKK